MRSTPCVALAFSDAPITVNKVATATPTISADAVAAVRRGLRSALSRASRPPTPRSAAIGAPSTAAAGRTATGPRTTNPARVPTAPAMAGPWPPPAVPAITAATPPAVSRKPRYRTDAGYPRRFGRELAQGGQRRHPGGPERRQHARQHGGRHPDRHREHRTGRPQHQAARWQREAEAVEDPLEQRGDADAARPAGHRTHHADDQRLGQPGHGELAPGAAQRA